MPVEIFVGGIEDVEFLFIARRSGFKIKEVGVTWENDPDSKVNPVADSMNMLSDVFKVRYNALKGKYDK